jgi:hopanoid biosynthesis associated RND transporter like protein HpnN
VAIVLLPQLHFDRNPLNLRDADSESVATLRELMEDSENPAMSITVLSPDAKSKQATATELAALPVVRDVVSADSLVPEVTDLKLELIDDLALVLGSSLEPSAEHRPKSAAETLAALHQLAEGLGEDSADSASRLAARLHQYLDELAAYSEHQQASRLDMLGERLFGNLDDSLSLLRDALEPGSATWADLPGQMQDRWINDQGLHRLVVYPREDINDNAALRRFVEDVQAIAPDATDEPVLGLRAGDAVVAAFLQAFTSAFIVITALLLLLLRDLRKTLLIISPLVLASLLASGVMAGFSIPFNFANVIALPLLFGIGVDHSIHMVQRASSGPSGQLNPLRTSTARAVLLSSLTTLCSFVNLLYSPHPGTASMGLVLTIGIGMMLLTTLVVLPAMLRDKTT